MNTLLYRYEAGQILDSDPERLLYFTSVAAARKFAVAVLNKNIFLRTVYVRDRKLDRIWYYNGRKWGATLPPKLINRDSLDWS